MANEGNLTGVVNTEQQFTGGEYGYYVQATTRTRSFIDDASGTILTKTDNAAITQQYYANDKSIGSVSATPGNPTCTTADFDFNFTPVSDSYPAITPGNYTVGNGDTLKGIAYRVYGDSKLWYLIADANGLSLDSMSNSGQGP